jgi:hypothetical protein
MNTTNQRALALVFKGDCGDAYHDLVPDYAVRCQKAVDECLGGDEGLNYLIAEALKNAPLQNSPLHGVCHWVSVFRNAMVIAELAKLNSTLQEFIDPNLDFTAVAILFALFHDCRRHTEGEDLTHGAFGSTALLSAIYGHSVFVHLEAEFAVAASACAMHTVVDFQLEHPCMEASKTMDLQAAFAIGMCLDADRLDLYRLGIEPHPKYLYHREESVQSFLKLSSAGAWG